MGKTITDPLYGSIALSKTEAEIVSTRAFQRLHNVRQLGLAYLVFPNAGYSRFAHSIGAGRNASKMLNAIERNSNIQISGKTKAAYRAAALLHDIGHYPFSHTTEQAVSGFYAGSLIKNSTIDRGGHDKGLKHEPVGELVLKHDPELREVIKNSKDVDPDLLSAIFRKNDPDPLFGIISSELDCDRLDYLARTAHLGGVPFGVVDTEFIIEKATLGRDSELAFEAKASKAIDHFLVGRYYDYMQMVFHKTVEGLEWSLSEAIKSILDRDHTLLSEKSVTEAIESGKWCTFDDNWMVTKIKQHLDAAQDSAGGDIRADHCLAVLYRKPAKRVWNWEALLPRQNNEVYRIHLKMANDAVTSVANSMGIPEGRFSVQRRNFPLIKIAASAIKDNYFEEELSRSIQLVGRQGQKNLVEEQSLLISGLSEYENYAANIYYLPRSGEAENVRLEIEEKLAAATKF